MSLCQAKVVDELGGRASQAGVTKQRGGRSLWVGPMAATPRSDMEAKTMKIVVIGQASAPVGRPRHQPSQEKR